MERIQNKINTLVESKKYIEKELQLDRNALEEIKENVRNTMDMPLEAKWVSIEVLSLQTYELMYERSIRDLENLLAEKTEELSTLLAAKKELEKANAEPKPPSCCITK